MGGPSLQTIVYAITPSAVSQIYSSGLTAKNAENAKTREEEKK